MLKLLIESGADVNCAVKERKHFPIELAACSGNLAKVKYLLNAGADINVDSAKGYTALLNMMYAGHNQDWLVPMADFLAKHGAVIDCETDYGESPVSVASRMGRFDIVRTPPRRWCRSVTTPMDSTFEGNCLGKLRGRGSMLGRNERH